MNSKNLKSLVDARHYTNAEEDPSGLLAAFQNHPSVIPALEDLGKAGIRRALEDIFPTRMQTILEAARRVMDHEFMVRGERFVCGDSIPWAWDFKHGKTIDPEFWSEIDTDDPDVVGDIRKTYELNRHSHFLVLGRAFHVTSNPSYSREIISQMHDWSKSNSPFMGINWTSSREVALRTIAWVWALHFIRDSSELTADAFADILATLFFHGDYLFRHHSEGVTTRGNDVVEGVALITLSLGLPELTHQRDYIERGQELVFDGLDASVHPDGVYAGHSLDGQVLMLEAGLLAHIMLARQGVEIPQSVRTRLLRMARFLECVWSDPGGLPYIGQRQNTRLLPLEGGEEWCRAILNTACHVFGSRTGVAGNGYRSERALWLLGKTSKYESRVKGYESESPRLLEFPDGGYYIIRDRYRNRESALVFDVGQESDGDLCDAVHHDALGIQLTVGGEAVLVDPGSHDNPELPWWDAYFQSTWAHNTVSLSGTSPSTQMDASSLLGRACELDRLVQRESHVLIQAHRRYENIEGGELTHTRKVIFVKPNIFLVKDSLTGGNPQIFDLRLHLGKCQFIEHRSNSELRAYFRNSVLRIVPLEREGLNLQVFHGEREPLNGWCTDARGALQPCHTIQYSKFGAPPIVFSTALYIEEQSSESEPDLAGLTDMET